MVRKNGLPRRVYLRHGAYYLVDLKGKWHRLCAERDGMPAMYRALATLQDAHQGQQHMPAVVAAWLATRRPHWGAEQRRDMEWIAGELAAAFAEFTPAQVTTPVCAEYLARYRDRRRTHNKQRNVLSQVLRHAAVMGLREGHNPVDNIGGMSTPGRHRIVTDDELQRVRAAAGTGRHDSSGRALVQMIDLATITGQRISDLLAMRWQDVTAAGVMVEQSKGRARGVRLCIEWTPALRAAVDACARGQDRVGHLLKTRTGSPYTYAGMRSAWDRACKRAGIEDLHIHDLRGRAGVDALEAGGLEGARALLGHATQRMTAHYTQGKHVPLVKPSR